MNELREDLHNLTKKVNEMQKAQNELDEQVSLLNRNLRTVITVLRKLDVYEVER